MSDVTKNPHWLLNDPEQLEAVKRLASSYTPKFREDDILAHNQDPVVDQLGFRFGSPGTETGHGFLAAENTDLTLLEDGNGNYPFFMRFELEDSTTNADQNLTRTYKLQYRVDTTGVGTNYGAWTDVTASSTHVQTLADSNITDGAATSDRLTTSTEAFRAGEYDESDGAFDSTTWVSTRSNIELLSSVTLIDAQLPLGSLVQFRIIETGGTLLDTYTRTPTLTWSGSAAGEVTETASVNVALQSEFTESGSTNIKAFSGFTTVASVLIMAFGAFTSPASTNVALHSEFTEPATVNVALHGQFTETASVNIALGGTPPVTTVSSASAPLPAPKPGTWNIDVGEVAPEWEWAWDRADFMVPLDDWSSRPRAYLHGMQATQAASWNNSANSSEWVQTSYGPGIQFDNSLTTTAEQLTFPLNTPLNNTEYTAAVFARRTGNVAISLDLLGYSGVSGGSTPFTIQAPTATNLRFRVYTNGGTVENASSGGGTTVPLNEDLLLVGRWRANVLTEFMIFDTAGRRIAYESQAASGGTLQDATGQDYINLGLVAARQRSWTGPVYSAYTWGRYVDDGYLAELAQDPFGPFRHRSEVEALALNVGVTTGEVTDDASVNVALHSEFTEPASVNVALHSEFTEPASVNIYPVPNSFVDHFPGSTLNSRWTALTAGSGSVTVTDSTVVLDGASAGDIGAIYLNQVIDPTRSQVIKFLINRTTVVAGGQCVFLVSEAGGVTTETGASAFSDFQAKTVTRVSMGTTGGLQYFTTQGGGRVEYQGSTNTWTTPPQTAWSPVNTDDYVEMRLEIDGDGTYSGGSGGFRWVVIAKPQTSTTWSDDQGMLFVERTPWVQWSTVWTSSDLYICFGGPQTEFANGIITLESVQLSDEQPKDLWVNSRTITGPNWVIEHERVFGDGLGPAAPITVGSNTELDVGTGGSWDDNYVKDPFVLDMTSVDGFYYMFYTGQDGTNFQIGLARSTSRDGPWTKSGSNPVITRSATTQRDQVFFPYAVYDIKEATAGKKIKVVYGAYDGTNWRVFYAYGATDFWSTGFTLYNDGGGVDTSALIDPGSTNDLDELGWSQPVLKWLNGRWHIYGAIKENGGPWHTGLALATVGATEPTSMTKESVPLIEGHVNAYEALTADLNGVTVTVADTSNFAQDMYVQVEDDQGTNARYSVSRVRKVLSGTQLELYHGLRGFTTANSSAIRGWTDWSPAVRDVRNIDGTWYLFVTAFQPGADDATYDGYLESTGVFRSTGNHLGPWVADHYNTPISYLGQAANDRRHSSENITFVNGPTHTTLNSEVTESGSTNIALHSEVTEAASTNLALHSEFTESGSTNIAAHGEVTESASINIATAAVDGEATEPASTNIALHGEFTEPASTNIALHSEFTEVGSINVALHSEFTEPASTDIAAHGQFTEAASLNIEPGYWTSQEVFPTSKSKGHPWNVDRAFTAPKWESIWDKTVAVLPIWDTSGFEAAQGLIADPTSTVIDGTPTMRTTPFGPGINLGTGTGVDWEYPNSHDMLDAASGNVLTFEVIFQTHTIPASSSWSWFISRSGANANVCGMSVESTGNIVFRTFGQGVFTGYTTTAGEWVHAIVVWTVGTGYDIWINGDKYGPVSLTDTSSQAGNLGILLGRDVINDNWDLDSTHAKFAIYNGALTQDEITQLFTDPFGQILHTNETASLSRSTGNPTGQVTEPASINIQGNGQFTEDASVNVALHSEFTEPASTNIARHSQVVPFADITIAAHGEATSNASINIEIVVNGQVTEPASTNIALHSEFAEPASTNIALHGQLTDSASVNVALNSEFTEPGSTNIAVHGQATEPVTINIESPNIPGEITETASVNVALHSEFTEPASTNIALHGQITNAASINLSQDRVGYAKVVGYVFTQDGGSKGSSGVGRLNGYMMAVDGGEKGGIGYSDVLGYGYVESDGVVTLQGEVTEPGSTNIAVHGQVTNSASINIAQGVASGQVTESASINIQGNGQSTEDASVNIALHSEFTEPASTNIALQSEFTEPGSTNMAVHGQVTDQASINLETGVGAGQVSYSASTNIQVHGQVTEAASINIEAHGQTTDLASVNIALSSFITDASSTNIALHGDASKAASVNVALQSQTSNDASTNVALHGQVTDAASITAALHGESTKPASVYITYPGQVTEPSSTNIAVHGEVTNEASINITTGVGSSQVTDLASVNVALHGEITKPASTNVAVHGEVTESGSVNIVLSSFITEAASTNIALYGQSTNDATTDIALHGQSTGAASVNLASSGFLTQDASVNVALHSQVASDASTSIALHSEVTSGASTDIALRGQVTSGASVNIAAGSQTTSDASVAIKVYGSVSQGASANIALHSAITEAASVAMAQHGQITDDSSVNVAGNGEVTAGASVRILLLSSDREILEFALNIVTALEVDLKITTQLELDTEI